MTVDHVVKTEEQAPEKAAEFEAVAWKLDRKTSPPPPALPDALDEYRGSGPVLALYPSRINVGAGPVTEAELRGGRMAEYSLYERFMLHVAAALLFAAFWYLAVALIIHDDTAFAFYRDIALPFILHTRRGVQLGSNDCFGIGCR